jgi:hypothetical protein
MSRLVSMFLLWLLLLLAAAPASAVMDVKPRNATWELPASSYDLAPDVRDGPNLYAYVRQNPWTKFDPDGLAETAVTKAIRERSQAVAQAYESAGRGDGAAAQKAQFTRGQAVAGAMAKGLNEIVSNTPIGAANEALTGKNASGEPLSVGEQLAVMAGFIPAGKFAGKLGKAGVDALATSAQKISKEADEIVNAIRKGGDGAAKRGPIEWANEGHGNPAAAAYEAGAAGHVPGKAPRLSATDAEGTVTAKFDGVDGGTMVDRKLSVTTFPKSERQMLRQSATAAENGYGVRWEVPTSAEQARAQKMVESLGVKNIDVQVK